MHRLSLRLLSRSILFWRLYYDVLRFSLMVSFRLIFCYALVLRLSFLAVSSEVWAEMASPLKSKFMFEFSFSTIFVINGKLYRDLETSRSLFLVAFCKLAVDFF